AETISRDLFIQHPLLILFMTPACFLTGWFLVYRYAPQSSGSGIPQIMAAIEVEEKKDAKIFHKLLGLRVALFKIFSSLLCVLGGGAVGREGPTLQISASIFYLFGQRFQRYSKIISLDLWILAGSAAGLAAAFNTPLGGIIYGIEELARKHFNKIKTILLWSVVISGLVSQWLVGSYLYLGYPKIGPIQFNEIPAAFLVGILGGIVGAAFGHYLLIFQEKFRKNKTAFQLVLVTLLSSILMIGLYVVDHRAFGPGNHFMAEILSGEAAANIQLVVVRFFSAFFSYLSGCAGGIFAPSLALGASLGSWIATFWQGLNPTIFALFGMTAVLTGVTRAPVTSFVLILEMTDRHNAIFFMMVTAMVALASAQIFGHESFYEKTKKNFLITRQ
ncbi:MAG: chloride channel protein, partial [Bdellovibrionota bacterium]